MLNPIDEFLVKNWSEFLKIPISIWFAWVATSALSTWKKQSKADKEIKFLDELTDSVHEFIQSLSGPKQMVSIIKIGINSHKGLSFDLEEDIENAEVVAYIKKSGKRDSERLIAALNDSSPFVSKIHSLIAKGQMFGFPNYGKCRDSCRMLTWQHERIEALAYMINSDTLNWRHPQVQATLTQVTSITLEDIQKYIEENNKSFLTFVKEIYELTYK